MRTLIWFIYFWAYLLFLVPSMKKAERLQGEGKADECDTLTQKNTRAWANALLHLAGVKVEIFGLENIPTEPCVYVCNHQGNFDIPILLTALPRANGILAKKELQKLPFIRNWMQLLNCVFIDRKNPRQAIAALNTAVLHIKKGHSIIVFPEGTRSRCAAAAEFKAGAFKIATKTKVKIVPLRIDGSYRVMEQNGGFIHPAEVKLTILPYVETQGLTSEEAKELPGRLREIITGEKTAPKEQTVAVTAPV
ncbi:MAG: lysophospholipid acyltransferase family protein [Hydrogenoanaerobacterium sp.]